MISGNRNWCWLDANWWRIFFFCALRECDLVVLYLRKEEISTADTSSSATHNKVIQIDSWVGKKRNYDETSQQGCHINHQDFTQQNGFNYRLCSLTHSASHSGQLAAWSICQCFVTLLWLPWSTGYAVCSHTTHHSSRREPVVLFLYSNFILDCTVTALKLFVLRVSIHFTQFSFFICPFPLNFKAALMEPSTISNAHHLCLYRTS